MRLWQRRPTARERIEEEEFYKRWRREGTQREPTTAAYARHRERRILHVGWPRPDQAPQTVRCRYSYPGWLRRGGRPQARGHSRRGQAGICRDYGRLRHRRAWLLK